MDEAALNVTSKRLLSPQNPEKHPGPLQDAFLALNRLFRYNLFKLSS